MSDHGLEEYIYFYNCISGLTSNTNYGATERLGAYTFKMASSHPLKYNPQIPNSQTIFPS